MAGEDWTPPGGSTHVFRVPKYDEAADAPQAFKDFAESIDGGLGLDFEADREGQVVQSLDGVDWAAGMALTVSETVPDDSVGEIGDVVFVTGDDDLKGSGGGLEGLGDWAEVTAMTGDPKRYDYTADGVEWAAFEWSDTSKPHTLTTQAGGLADVLVISGGNTGGTHPQGGRIRDGIENIGTSNEIVVDTPGGSSAGGRLGDIKVPAIGAAINSGNVIGAGGFGTTSSEKVNGVLSSITGTAIEYGTALRNGDGSPVINGNLGPAGPGSSERDGVVIVRVPASKVTATGGWV